MLHSPQIGAASSVVATAEQSARRIAAEAPLAWQELDSVLRHSRCRPMASRRASDPGSESKVLQDGRVPSLSPDEPKARSAAPVPPAAESRLSRLHAPAATRFVLDPFDPSSRSSPKESELHLRASVSSAPATEAGTNFLARVSSRFHAKGKGKRTTGAGDCLLTALRAHLTCYGLQARRRIELSAPLSWRAAIATSESADGGRVA